MPAPDLNVVLAVPLVTTSLAATMAVNTLVTGLIVFRILKVFLEAKATRTSVERTLGSTGGTKFRHIIFVIIESGMMLFVIQLIRTVLYALQLVSGQPAVATGLEIASDFMNSINEMFNVISSFLLLLFY